MASTKKMAKNAAKKNAPRPVTSKAANKAVAKRPAANTPASKPAPKPAAVPTSGRIAAFGNQRVSILLDDELAPAAAAAAVKNFLSLERAALTAIEGELYRYYQDIQRAVGADDVVAIATPSAVWKHVQFGGEASVGRRDGDRAVYISLECNCDWEPEHGLQLVFRDGARVTKLGPYDGHLSNADAYDDPSLANVIYRGENR